MATLTFLDIDGNPLIAGVFASIAPQAGGAAQSGFLQVGGTVAVTVSAANYVVTLTGSNAPAPTLTFTATGSDQTITVPAYCSPVYSQTGYAVMQASLWPNGWFNDAARTTGGIAYNLAMGNGGVLLNLSEQNQAVILNARLESSSGTNIDLWFQDILGSTFQRLPGETDIAYVMRGEARLSARNGTRAGMMTIAGYYGTVSIVEPFRADTVSGLDSSGWAFGAPTCGFGSLAPNVQVYIASSSPIANPAQAQADIMASRPLGLQIHGFNVVGSTATPL